MTNPKKRQNQLELNTISSNFKTNLHTAPLLPTPFQISKIPSQITEKSLQILTTIDKCRSLLLLYFYNTNLVDLFTLMLRAVSFFRSSLFHGNLKLPQQLLPDFFSSAKRLDKE
jgi:hypothetical protein